MNVNELRGKIFTQSKSIAAFAKSSKLSKPVLYNILSGKKLPNSDEIAKIGEACGLNADDIKRIFLS